MKSVSLTLIALLGMLTVAQANETAKEVSTEVEKVTIEEVVPAADAAAPATEEEKK